MKHNLLICCFGLLFFGLQPNAQSQDRFYSQIFANRLQLSPALAGSEEVVGQSIMTQARWQWIGIENHLQQYGAAYHSNFYTLGRRFGYGVNYQMERTADGGYTQNKLDFHFSHTIHFVRYHFLSFGLAGGIQQQALDFSILRFPPQIINGQLVPSFPVDSIGRSYQPDFQAGFAYYYKSLFAIGSVKHFQDIRLRDSGPNFPNPFYSLTMGVKLGIGDSLFGKAIDSYLTPLFHYQRQGRYYLMVAGIDLELAPITLSLRYAINNRWSGGIAIRRGPFQLAYQYDHFVGNFVMESFGPTHELSLKCVINNRHYMCRVRHYSRSLPKF
ncbi:MAG: PorP/SprF family type IX secretion system membrane protein [Bacteroidota bacterium]